MGTWGRFFTYDSNFNDIPAPNVHGSNIILEKCVTLPEGDNGLIDTINTTANHVVDYGYGNGIVSTKILYDKSISPISIEVSDVSGIVVETKATVDISIDGGSTWTTGNAQGTITNFPTYISENYRLKLRFNVGTGYEINIGSGNVWATTSSMPYGPSLAAGCGTTAATLNFGGSTSVAQSCKWSGSSWATTSNLNQARWGLAGCGTTAAALSMGGNTTASNSVDSVATTEKWSGSSWATTTSLVGAKFSPGGCGTTAAALAFGGASGIYLTITEKWGGSSWATTTTFSYGRQSIVGCGTTADALIFGGYPSASSPFRSNLTDKWDGSAWATTSTLNQDRTWHGGCGDTSSALCFGGNSNTSQLIRSTEIWSGSTWATTSSLINNKEPALGSGTVTNALCAGGSGDTEIWGPGTITVGKFQGFYLKINN